MLTAIELGTKTLTAVTVKLNGRGPEIVRSGTADLAAPQPDDIRSALAKCGVDAPRGVLVVPRGQALFRELEVPDGTPEELVAMVRFQVEKELPFPIDQVRYSYIETGRAGGKVRVQVVAVPRDVIDPAVAALEAAGVKVAGAYVSSFGLLSLSPDGETAAMVEAGGGEAEILVADHGRMDFSRTASLEEGFSAATLAEEIQRSLLSYAAKSPGKEIQKVILAGEGEAATALAAAVRERLSRDVVAVGPGDLETAPAASLCAALLRGTPLPDLLHPPVAIRKFRLTRKHRVAGLAALVGILVILWSQMALADKRTELAKRKEELKTLDPRVTQVTKLQQQAQLAHQWWDRREVWLDVLFSLRQNINTTNLWITNASFEDPGIIRLQGKAKDDKHVTGLVAALTKAGKFRDIQIDKINPNRAEKAEYKNDFSITAHLSGYDPKKKK